MAAIDELLRDFQVKQRTVVMHGLVANDISEPSDELFVTIDAFDGGRQQWGPCPWSPASSLPVRGQSCLVFFDEQEAPWVMALAPVTASGGDGYLDGGKPDSNYGAIAPIDGGSV